jgi:glycosyltransferase involved in cell wall biosynthesis
VNHAALLIPTLDRLGGAERQVMSLARGLSGREWRVSVVALSGAGGVAAEGLRDCGVGFLSLGMRKGLADPRGWIRFNRWLREARPDVVHAHLPHAAWLARWSRLAAPMPIFIDTLHSSSTGGRGRRFGYRFSRGLPHHVTAVSCAVADSHLREQMVNPAALSVVPNGVDTSVWKPDATARAAARREFGLGDEFLWIAAGRLEPVKDFAMLLAAMARLPGTAQLLIAGDGPLRSELQRKSESSGLCGRVRFLGFQPKLLRWMQAADAFVLSSLWEGLPMALLEAAACAMPAVATDVPGVREVIEPGASGLLVPSHDSSALAEAMHQMMRMPLAERLGMGLRARRRASANFDMDAVLDHWDELYKSLLQNPGSLPSYSHLPRPAAGSSQAPDCVAGKS